MLFGSAYKGISLASTIAIALAEMGYNYPFCFNRRKVKDFGEGGVLVVAPLKGRATIDFFDVSRPLNGSGCKACCRNPHESQISSAT